MTSYNTYSFLRHIRSTAWDPERGGSVRDGIAEICWYLSQNTANIALLLPKAGLCLALLLTFSSSQPGTLALADSGSIHRDRTFFNPQDGTLSGYAEGVLIANAAWAVWRTLVWLFAWYAVISPTNLVIGGLLTITNKQAWVVDPQRPWLRRPLWSPF